MSTQRFLGIFFIYAFTAFLLNFFWESWHSFSLYQGHSIDDFPVPKYVSLMTYVSYIDMLIISAVFIGGCILWKTKSWFIHMTYKKWIYFISSLMIAAIIIEVKGVFFYEQWSYSMSMPIIFSIGVSPLVQLALTGSISLFILKLFYKNYQK